jgi:uncharacterized iron-regulated membrane protein
MFSSPRAMRRWAWLHKWSSLVCTAFMLLLCITGLPLIFHHEIAHLLGNVVEAPEMAADTPHVSMDKVMEVAQARFPGKVGMFASQEEDDDRVWYVTLSDTPTTVTDLKQAAVDARTGEVLNEPPLDRGVMFVIYKLHVDLFAGLPGMLFLGFMGMLLLLSLVSGTVLYAPFMRRLRFGEVRRERSTRIKWLDLHNLLGIVTLVWLFVVGGTGVVNTWADLFVNYWKNDQLAQMVSNYKGKPPPAHLGSLDAAVKSALKAEPDMAIKFIAFPGTSFSSPHHYAVFMRGNEPFTKRILKPVLVDAVTAEVTDSRAMPWYFYILKLSQPLHFGDYGGTPMQIIWALLDLISIIVLGSGLYLWLVKRRQRVPNSADEAETPRIAQEGA